MGSTILDGCVLDISAGTVEDTTTHQFARIIVGYPYVTFTFDPPVRFDLSIESDVLEFSQFLTPGQLDVFQEQNPEFYI